MTSSFDIAIEAAEELLLQASKHSDSSQRMNLVHEAADFLLAAIDSADEQEHHDLAHSVHDLLLAQVNHIRNGGAMLASAAGRIASVENQCLDDLAKQHHISMARQVFDR